MKRESMRKWSCWMDKDEMKKLEKEKGELKSESSITSCDVS